MTIRQLVATLFLAGYAAACGDNLALSPDGGAEAIEPDVDAGPKGELWFRRESGKILALREQSELFLDEERAAEIDELLERAKKVDVGVPWIDLSAWYARAKENLERISLVVHDPQVAAAWQRGWLVTGHDELDELVASLEPTRVTYEHLDQLDLDYYELWFSRWVNVYALENRLNELGLVYASVQPFAIDGSDIEIAAQEGPDVRAGDARQIDAEGVRVYLKWGDCFSWCIWSHYWDVMVPHDPTLRAELVGEGGDSLDDF